MLENLNWIATKTKIRVGQENDQIIWYILLELIINIGIRFLIYL